MNQPPELQASTPEPSLRDAIRQPQALALLALLALLIIGGPIALWLMTARSSASFADSEILDENRLGAATLDVELGDNDIAFEASNLAPGDNVSGHLEVKNVGSLPLEFGVTARASQSTLRDWLVLSLWQASGSCAPDDLLNGSATSTFTTDASIASGRATLADHSIGGQAGLLLAPGEEVTLCVGATLSLDAPNETQGQQMVIDITIDAQHDLDAEAG